MVEMRTLGGMLWEKKDCDLEFVEEVRKSFGVSEFLAKCLSQLKPQFESMEEVRSFLSPSMADYHDPHLMKGMSEAEARLRRAIAEREKIRIVTDYDVDGTMSSLILQATLKILGHTALSYHIPHRKAEGYGFSTAAAQKAVEDGVGLIVTADIGVRDVEAIHYAQSHGVDVIVLDHHLPQGCGVPEEAYVVVCPKQEGCTYPNPELAACGISLKLAQAMLSGCKGYARIIESMSKLAALGTVADVVSLRNIENRAIVATGLRALNSKNGNNMGLSALLNVSNLKSGQVDASQIAFNLAPKINAAGRMASATHVVDLINATNEVQAQNYAEELRLLNEARKEIQGKMVERAQAFLESHSEEPFLFVAFEESDVWQSGIAGIVAGRLKEHYNKTVAVGTIAGGEVVCSLRATPGVHAVEAINRVSDKLLRWGGHAAAAGLTLAESQIDAFCREMCKSIQEQLNGEVEVLRESYVETLTPDDVTEALFDDLDKLEPCGKDNRRPDVCLVDAPIVRVSVCRNNSWRGFVRCPQFDLVVWIPSNLADALGNASDRRLTLFGKLDRGYYGDKTQYSMQVRDILE